jgi:hypothetical protein
MAKPTKCKCPYQKDCNLGHHAAYSINAYSKAGEIVKRLKFFVGQCSKADELAVIHGVRNPALTVCYDNA